MTRLPVDSDLTEDICADLAELERLDASSRNLLKRRLILWAIRWAIGFAIIGIVVRYNPEWVWLWWIGAAFAAITPLMTLTAYIVLRRKSQQARKSLLDLETVLEEEQ